MWTLEHDRKMTPTNISRWTWPKNRWIWPKKYKWKFIQFRSYSHLEVHPRSDFILLFLIWSYLPVNVCRCRTFSVMFQWCMFVGVTFLFMYKFFGYIHSVILNWSNEYSSEISNGFWNWIFRPNQREWNQQLGRIRWWLPIARAPR